MLNTLFCNMDIKFIGSLASAKAILYYITDYITKTPLKAHIAYAALKAAKEKVQHLFHILSSPLAIGKSMLVKSTNGIIAKQELSGPQVASYLLGNRDRYTLLISMFILACI